LILEAGVSENKYKIDTSNEDKALHHKTIEKQKRIDEKRRMDQLREKQDIKKLSEWY
jgi:hypothetical protein